MENNKLIDRELFSNMSACESNCYGLSGSKYKKCMNECNQGVAPTENVQKSSADWSGILSGVAELVNAGGSIYATRVASKQGVYLPSAYGSEQPIYTDPLAEEAARKKKTTNTVLISVGVLAVVGVLLYFGLRDNK